MTGQLGARDAAEACVPSRLSSRAAHTRRARSGTPIPSTWAAHLVAALVLVLLLAFALQKTISVRVPNIAASGTVPLGVLLLLAATVGVLLAGVVPSPRTVQIRRRDGAGPGAPGAPAPARLAPGDRQPADPLDPPIDIAEPA